MFFGGLFAPFPITTIHPFTKLCPAKIRFVGCAKRTVIALRIQNIKELATKQHYTVNGFWNRQWQLSVLLISLLINIVPAYAQNFCPTSTSAETGGFSVPTQVCAGKVLAVTGVPTSLVNIRYIYQYSGNGIPAGIQSTSNIYTTPGSYTIMQTAAGPNATGTFACRVVEVLPVTAVAFSTVSCANRVVTLTYTLDAQTIRYDFLTVNWGDGSAPSTIVLNHTATTGSVQHTYTGTATSYLAAVSGSYTNACTGNLAQQPVKIQASTAVSPTINALTSDDTKATINFQGASGYNLELYKKAAGGIYAPTGLTGVSGGTFTIPALPTDVNCFQVVATDGCGNSSLRSAEVCSVVITAKAEDRKNTVTWAPYAGTDAVRFYRVTKNGIPAGLGTSPYTDATNITCGKNYCYSLEVVTQGTTTVKSASVCVTGIDNGTVASPVSAYVSVEPTSVKVQATLPTLGLPSPYTLVISRAAGVGGAFAPIGTSNDRSYVDLTAQTNSQSYCYQTAIQNSCGVLSTPTPSACTILLTKTADGKLTWTPNSPYSNEPPQSYQIIFIDPLTGASDKKPLGNVTTYRPDPDSQVTQYQIAAVNNAGIESYSNPLEIELGLRVFLPNAFTPNGDQQNQFFMAKGLMAFWSTFEMTIYSRWGDVVYNTTDKNTTGWNGEINGTPAQSGYYGYRVKLTDNTGKGFERTGQVLLIR